MDKVEVAPDTAENDRAARDRLCRYVCEVQPFLHQDTCNKLELVMMDYIDNLSLFPVIKSTFLARLDSVPAVCDRIAIGCVFRIGAQVVPNRASRAAFAQQMLHIYDPLGDWHNGDTKKSSPHTLASYD